MTPPAGRPERDCPEPAASADELHVLVVGPLGRPNVYIGSAPTHAYAIETENRCDSDEEFPYVTCRCGWKGPGGHLLGVDENETLWCPQCRTWGNWTWD